MKIGKYWCTTLLCILTISAATQTFAWQPDSHLKLQIGSDVRLLDSIESTRITLTHQKMSFDWLPSSDWIISENQSPVASAQFIYRTIPSLKLQLIVYPKNTWLSDMKDESIIEYIESLPIQFPDGTIELTNEGQHTPPIGSVPFLERTFRKVFYTVTKENTETPPLTIYDYWTVTEEGVLVIARYSGEHDRMEKMKSTFERELAQFMLAE